MLVAPDGERYHWKLTTGWGSNTLKVSVHPSLNYPGFDVSERINVVIGHGAVHLYS